MPTAQKIIAPYKPLPWQIDPWKDKEFLLLLSGSAGGGKSRLAAEKVHAYLKHYPGSTGLMVRKTRESMVNSTVLFMERKVIGPDPGVRHIQQKHRFEYDNDSILVYGGMKDEQQRESIRSIGQDGALDIAWMEEATKFREDDFNELLSRMRGKAAPWQQIIVSTNPESPYHWIYKRLILGKEASFYPSSAKDNPYLPASYMEVLDRIAGVLGLRLREGKWVQAEGVIYQEFDESVHIIDRFEIPADWKRFRSFDFGYEHPFVCLWWAMDPDGRLYLYRQIYMTHRIVAEHAKQINYLSESEKSEYSVSDHDAEDRETLRQSGISTIPANKAVSVGIQAVLQRFMIAGDGKPRIFFMRDSLVELDPWLVEHNLPTCLEEELTLYSWKRTAAGVSKDEPLKEHDHASDATRYLVMAVDNKNRLSSFDFFKEHGASGPPERPTPYEAKGARVIVPNMPPKDFLADLRRQYLNKNGG